MQKGGGKSIQVSDHLGPPHSDRNLRHHQSYYIAFVFKHGSTRFPGVSNLELTLLIDVIPAHCKSELF